MEYKISVILTVYNGEQYLRECLESISRQTIRPYEVIIVDDGSEDNSKEIIEEFEDFILVAIENRGVAAARNLALEKSSGDLITFIDQDDIWLENSLESRYNHFIEHEASQIVIGKQKWFLSGLNEMPSWVKPEQMNDELNGYLLGCAMISRSLFSEFGTFDESFRFSSDFDWFFRLKDHQIQFHQVEKLVLYKRIHQFNESRHASLSLKELSRAVFNSIKRKRALQSKDL